jgi:pilus assembly protein CpaB
MGKTRTYVILGVGVVVALIAGLLAHGWLNGEVAAQARAAGTQPVIVASVDLKWGTVIAKDMVKTVPFLKRTVPPGSFADPQKIEGRTLRYPIKANEPIFESQLAPTTVAGGGIAAVIGPQKRAMAVKVDKVIGVSGFIHPGNRVDVLVTLKKSDREAESVTKTVLENVLVLATGSEMEKAGPGEKPTPVDVITLELSIDEGERLALAVTEGRIQLALRNLADSQSVATKGTTIPGLLASLTGPAPVENRPVKVRKAPAKASRETEYAVEVIKGANVSALKFQKGE